MKATRVKEDLYSSSTNNLLINHPGYISTPSIHVAMNLELFQKYLPYTLNLYVIIGIWDWVYSSLINPLMCPIDFLSCTILLKYLVHLYRLYFSYSNNECILFVHFTFIPVICGGKTRLNTYGKYVLCYVGGNW